MQKMLSNKWVILAFVAPAVLLYAMVVPYPLLKSIQYSFYRWNIIGTAQFVGFQNYVRIFTSDYVFTTALKNTALFTIGSIVLQIPLAFILAVSLTKVTRLNKFFKSVYFLPCTISGAAVSLLWQFIYHPNMGIINAVLKSLGLGGWARTWLAEPDFALWAVVISISWQWFGYHMVIFLTSLSTISPEIFEAAEVDGATGWKKVWYITYPLMKPFIKISMILITTSSIKAFDNVYVLTGGGPANSSTVLALHMYNRAFLQLQYGYGAALAVILLILCVVLSGVLNKVFGTKNAEY
ncbi:MAG TPA: sugar ABC transporter permease [Firmicutes bacterium]|jgi:raffinose/stachyose/melibiose transport system permease protein|nr:sugar ABC transporter permease [Bacillota bacterium]